MSRLIKSSWVDMGDSYVLYHPKNEVSEHEVAEGEQVTLGQQGQDIIKKAEEESKRIIAQALGRVEQLRRVEEEAIARDRQRRLDEGYEEGKNLGFQEGQQIGRSTGYEESKQQEAKRIAELEQLLVELTQHYEQTLKKREVQLKDLALAIAEKVVCQKIQEHEYYLVMVREALEEFRQYQWVDLYIGEEETALQIYLEEHLADFIRRDQNLIRIKATQGMPSGSCVIETDEGVVDIGVHTQLERINEELERVTL